MVNTKVLLTHSLCINRLFSHKNHIVIQINSLEYIKIKLKTEYSTAVFQKCLPPKSGGKLTLSRQSAALEKKRRREKSRMTPAFSNSCLCPNTFHKVSYNTQVAASIYIYWLYKVNTTNASIITSGKVNYRAKLLESSEGFYTDYLWAHIKIIFLIH